MYIYIYTSLLYITVNTTNNKTHLAKASKVSGPGRILVIIGIHWLHLHRENMINNTCNRTKL